MDKTALIRDRVEAAALMLGASRASVFKWRKRGVPGRWQIRIVALSKGTISVGDMLMLTNAIAAQRSAA